MAYGAPLSTSDIPRYLQHITGGKATPLAINALQNKYQAIGGSPLHARTLRLATTLQKHLSSTARVFTAFKHSPPFIEEAVEQIAGNYRRLIALVLAPHHSTYNEKTYFERLSKALSKKDTHITSIFIRYWHLNPSYIESVCEVIKPALNAIPEEHRLVCFSAHSLPVVADDPYPNQLKESAEALAQRLSLSEWRLAYQSASGRGWLAPTVEDIAQEAKRTGKQVLVVCPFGFVSENLETLYDLDIALRRYCWKENLMLVRVPTPDACPHLSEALLTEISKHIHNYTTRQP